MKMTDPSGAQFQRLIDHGPLYIDKSLLIKDILDVNPEGAYLFIRPEGFGKSVNISMLEAFFDLEYGGNEWFDSLEISEYPDCDRYMNAFPVIRIDMGDLVSGEVPGFDGFIDSFGTAMARTFSRFAHLLESDAVYNDEKRTISNALDRGLDRSDLGSCVRELSIALERHYGARPVILIDDYDRPVTEASPDAQKDALGFIGGFMSATLKSNPHYQMAYVTGATHVTMAGIYSGLNNLKVDDASSVRSGRRFGFTEMEVWAILQHYGHTEMLDDVRERFDVHRFGDAEVYSPRDIMGYVSANFDTDDPRVR